MAQLEDISQTCTQFSFENDKATAAVCELEGALQSRRIGFTAEVAVAEIGQDAVLFLRWAKFKGRHCVLLTTVRYAVPVRVIGGAVAVAGLATKAEQLTGPAADRARAIAVEQAALARTGESAYPIPWRQAPPTMRIESFPHLPRLLDAIAQAGKQQLADARENYSFAGALSTAAQNIRAGNDPSTPTGRTQTTALQ